MVVRKHKLVIREEDKPYVKKVEELIDQCLEESFGGASPESECWVTFKTIRETTNLPGTSITQVIEWVKATYKAAGWEVSFEYPLESDEGGHFIFK